MPTQKCLSFGQERMQSKATDAKPRLKKIQKSNAALKSMRTRMDLRPALADSTKAFKNLKAFNIFSGVF